MKHRSLMSLLCIVCILAALTGPLRLAQAEPDFRIVWEIPGLPPKTAAIDVQLLEQRLVQVQLIYADAAKRGNHPAPINLRCQNAESGEIGQIALTAIASQPVSQGWALQFNLGQVWMDLPYPIDPWAVESKPMAIISQRTGISPFSMEPAQLRQEFARTVEYMLTTASHHYAMPFGDGLVNCTFVDGSAQPDTSSQSATLPVQFGRGLPEGVYPRDFSVPDVTGWPTWAINGDFKPPSAADSKETRAELDALLALQATRTQDQIALIRRWDNGSAVGPWIEIMLDAIIRHNMNPVRASRALALVSVAMYDATIVGVREAQIHHRSSPCILEPRLRPVDGCGNISYPAEHAVVGRAAASVLEYLFPDQAQQFDKQAQEAATTRLWAGAALSSDVDAGLSLGRAVGEVVIARAKADGSDAVWDGVKPSSATWVPTPPDFQRNPLEPLAGKWRTWNLKSGSQFRPGPPPAPGSPQFDADVREVYAVTTPLSLDNQQIASYWEDKKGSYTPPGHWNVIALRLVRANGLSTAQAALVFAALNTAEADAFIACWDTKFTYWSVRPVTAIQQTLDPHWNPYIYTPPFPSYVSGHSTGSGAASTVLKFFFAAQSSQLDAWAEQAAISRLFGGIHFRADNEGGLALGRRVGEETLARLKNIQWKITLQEVAQTFGDNGFLGD